MKLNLYVLVQDMERSVGFYREVFGAEPVLQTPGYTAFALDGGLYGLFNAAHYPQPVKPGNNVTPNLLVDDIEREHARIGALAPAFLSPITANGPYRLFVTIDPDGNGIEFYSEG